jgi:hypothetical protein
VGNYKNEMKKTTTYFLTLATIGGLTYLNSCSSDPNKNTEKANLVSTVSNKPRVDRNLYLLWDYIRRDSALVKKIFNEGGNSFKFKPTDDINFQDTVHAYIYFDSNPVNKRDSLTKSLFFQFIKKKDDEYIENDFFQANPKFVNTDPQPIKVESHKFNYDKDIVRNNRDNILLDTVINRIKNWNNSAKRNHWISQQFKNNNTGIFQAFVINGIDFGKNTEHRCYFGLIYDSTTHSYSPDLIIVNTVTKKILSLALDNSANFEDLTRPVPPFGNESKTDFKLIEEIEYTIKN